jgi:hypothetical protein
MSRIVTAVLLLLLMALSAVTAEFVAHEGMLWMDVWRDNRTHRT